MKIQGLKVLTDKGWKQESTFVNDAGTHVNIPANHKAVLIDENKDIINATIITDKPLTLVEGGKVDIVLAGSVTKSQFGWTLKATLA